MQLILDTKDAALSAEGGLFIVRSGEVSKKISPKKLTSIAVTRQCHIASDAILLAVENQIPILVLDRLGRVQARLWSPYFGSLADLRRRQVLFALHPAAAQFMLELLAIKLAHCEAVLQRLKRRKTGQKELLEEAAWRMQEQGRKLKILEGRSIPEIRSNIMAAEGAATRPYWDAVGKVLPNRFQFDKRTRMPAQDPFNAALNYLYGMLYGVVEGGIFAAGLDPHLGLLHVDQHDKPTLAFDLIEAFRPWVDDLVIQYALDGHLLSEYFLTNNDGVLLSKPGKAFLIPAFNDLMQERCRFLEQESSRKNHIYRMAGLLARRIRDFEPPELTRRA